MTERELVIRTIDEVNAQSDRKRVLKAGPTGGLEDQDQSIPTFKVLVAGEEDHPYGPLFLSIDQGSIDYEAGAERIRLVLKVYRDRLAEPCSAKVSY